MMKILLVAEYYPPQIMGGGEINLAQTAQALAEKHEVAVLTSFFERLPKEEVVKKVQVVRRLRTGKSTATLLGNLKRRFIFPNSVEKEVEKIMAEFNPDILHFIGTSIIAAPKLAKFQKKMFATIESYPTLCPKGDRLFQGQQECTINCSWKNFVLCQKESDEIGKMKNKWHLKYNPLFWWLTFRYFRKLNSALGSCHLVSISGYVHSLLQQYGHSSVVIPNAFDAAPFKVLGEKKKGKTKPLILYAGALIKSKGPQILLEALRGLNCRAEFYSEGILKEKMWEYIKHNNIDAEIFAPWPYERVPEMYARADIVVFPSLWPEPFGRIPLEAMAAGKPIIASNIGAIPGVVEGNGTLIPPGDAAALRAALQNILKRRSGNQERVGRILAKYKSAAIVSLLERAYAEH